MQQITKPGDMDDATLRQRAKFLLQWQADELERDNFDIVNTIMDERVAIQEEADKRGVEL